jgi:long-subunit acyl-CoA synthetase (AMP-forming)
LVHSLLYITTPFVTISPYWTSFELEHTLTPVKPTWLFVNIHLLPLVLPVKLGICSQKICVFEENGEAWRNLEGMINTACSLDFRLLGPRPATKDSLAYLMFSSGTSGLPKGEVHHEHCCFFTSNTARLSSGYGLSWQHYLFRSTEKTSFGHL